MTNTLNMLLLILVSYLIGSISFAVLFTRIFAPGKNLREIGSGNLGATNVVRAAGILPAFLTFLGDSGKGAIIYLISKNYYGEPIALLAGAITLLGHIYPIWHQFKGGKGVATALGLVLASDPLTGIIMLLVWLVIFKVTRIVSLASITSFVFYILCHLIFANYSNYQHFFAIFIAVLIIFRHKENIIRLSKGEEHSFKK